MVFIILCMEEENRSEDIKKLEKIVAKRIQEERKLRKMSQMELALESGVSQGYLAMIEVNKKIPTITTIFKIAKALKISPSVLLEEEISDRELIKKEIIELIQTKL